ncbi:MAG: hypothetical protein O4806_04675 [Trichodesmium sp. St5_bin8]|nr:hypothetical protein [Trichodesmium sp. St5_bin8]
MLLSLTRPHTRLFIQHKIGQKVENNSRKCWRSLEQTSIKQHFLKLSRDSR